MPLKLLQFIHSCFNECFCSPFLSVCLNLPRTCFCFNECYCFKLYVIYANCCTQINVRDFLSFFLSPPFPAFLPFSPLPVYLLLLSSHAESMRRYFTYDSNPISSISDFAEGFSKRYSLNVSVSIAVGHRQFTRTPTFIASLKK